MKDLRLATITLSWHIWKEYLSALNCKPRKCLPVITKAKKPGFLKLRTSTEVFEHCAWTSYYYYDSKVNMEASNFSKWLETPVCFLLVLVINSARCLYSCLCNKRQEYMAFLDKVFVLCLIYFHLNQRGTETFQWWWQDVTKFRP